MLRRLILRLRVRLRRAARPARPPSTGSRAPAVERTTILSYDGFR